MLQCTLTQVQMANPKLQKLGVIGGTFDPIHIGHLLIAQEAIIQESLDRVLFVPASEPWMKSGIEITPVEQRLEMVRLAIEGNPLFEISEVDIRRPGPTYTVDTLRELATELKSGTELFFIMGFDSLAEFPKWKQPLEVLKLARLLVFPRAEGEAKELERLYRAIPQLRNRMQLFKTPVVPIGSTELRKRLSEVESVRYWIPDTVLTYIHEKRLYQKT